MKCDYNHCFPPLMTAHVFEFLCVRQSLWIGFAGTGVLCKTETSATNRRTSSNLSSLFCKEPLAYHVKWHECFVFRIFWRCCWHEGWMEVKKQNRPLRLPWKTLLQLWTRHSQDTNHPGSLQPKKTPRTHRYPLPSQRNVWSKRKKKKRFGTKNACV
jgi:hypothetical protein